MFNLQNKCVMLRQSFGINKSNTFDNNVTAKTVNNRRLASREEKHNLWIYIGNRFHFTSETRQLTFVLG